MNLRLWLGMTVFLGGTLLVMPPAVAKDKKSGQQAKSKQHTHTHEAGEHEGHGPGEMSPEMMAAWMKSASPGEHHRHLQSLIGDWSYTLKMRMTPEMPWTESSGTSSGEWIMGGRYLVDKVEGESMGMPFHGMGITGYDNLKQKYQSVWVDNMSTMLMISEGECDGSGKVFTFHGKADDLMTGRKDVPYKNVIRVVNDDKHVFEWWTAGPDGKSFKMMEIVYTRK